MIAEELTPTSPLNPNAVSELFMKCLFTDEEIAELNGDVPVGAVIVEGITIDTGFHPKRLEEAREAVKEMLDELPLEFQPATKGGGGGWSFLNMCNDKNGVLWTGMHSVMQELILLAIGLDLMAFLMPRDMWAIFPGGMPYVGIK